MCTYGEDNEILSFLMALMHSTARRLYPGHHNLIMFVSVNIDQLKNSIETPFPFIFIEYSSYL